MAMHALKIIKTLQNPGSINTHRPKSWEMHRGMAALLKLFMAAMKTPISACSQGQA